MIILFGTNKIVTADTVPFHELALMYLKNNPANLKTPRDYVEQYIKIRQEMYDDFFKEFDKYDKPYK